MAIAGGTENAVGRWLGAVARWLAVFGGGLLVLMALVTVVSITGRALIWAGLGPVRGDFELVELGSAIAVFSFLPLAQLHRGHVTVDVVVQAMPTRLRLMFGLLGDAVMAVISFVILWRLWLGFGEKFPYGSDALRAGLGMGYRPFYPETTYELQIPVWYPYGLCVLGAALFFIVSLYTVWRSVNWLLDGREAPV